MGRHCTLTKVSSFLMIGILLCCVYSLFKDRTRFGVGLNQKDKRQEMTDRVQHMRKVCEQYPVRRHLKTNIGHAVRLFYISQKYNFSYCRVAKVGSTFWTQVFLTITGMADGNTAFDIPRDQAHETMKSHNNLLMSFNDKRVHTTTSFMVGRNPYSRLFSSYVDQIFLPNKWSDAAFMVTGKKRRRCGSDVTFDEFLNYISGSILNGEKTDLHWTPIFSICLPCETKVSFLSKQETFDEDVDFILNEVGVDTDIVNQVNKATETSAVDVSIKSLVHTYVTKGHDVKQGCISEFGLASKIWRAFQIQGHIHNDINFPAEKFEKVTELTVEEVLCEALLKAAAKKPLSKKERNAQRQNWKVKFWSEISPETLAKVQDAFYEDFYIFQYNLDPSTM